MVADIVDVAVNLANGTPRRIEAFREAGLSTGMVSMDDVSSRYYLRIQVQDKAGILAKVAAILSENNISVDSVMQRPFDGDDVVSIIILTHEAVEKNIRAAIAGIEALDYVNDKITLLRIEDI